MAWSACLTACFEALRNESLISMKYVYFKQKYAHKLKRPHRSSTSFNLSEGPIIETLVKFYKNYTKIYKDFTKINYKKIFKLLFPEIGKEITCILAFMQLNQFFGL